jgi:hypothetical protein
VERIQQDPRLTANRSKSVNSSIAEVGGERGYVGFVERNVLISQVPVRVARTLLSAFRRGDERENQDYASRERGVF